jgi:hypothetical protein
LSSAKSQDFVRPYLLAQPDRCTMASRTSGDVDGTESSYKAFRESLYEVWPITIKPWRVHHLCAVAGIATELLIGQSGDARRLVRPLCFVTGISLLDGASRGRLALDLRMIDLLQLRGSDAARAYFPKSFSGTCPAMFQQKKSSSRMTSRIVISGGRRSKASSHEDPRSVHTRRRTITWCTASTSGATNEFSLSADSMMVTISKLTWPSSWYRRMQSSSARTAASMMGRSCEHRIRWIVSARDLWRSGPERRSPLLGFGQRRPRAHHTASLSPLCCNRCMSASATMQAVSGLPGRGSATKVRLLHVQQLSALAND